MFQNVQKPSGARKTKQIEFPARIRLEGNDFKSSNLQSGPVETGGDIFAHFQYIHYISKRKEGGGMLILPQT
jgi:hypothetical protein